MLLEALNFAATYAISPRRRPAEINSSVALWARARRCARDWAAHEAHSKAFVLEAVEMLPERRVAAVLGSGLLRDVPIEALSKAFAEVRLYDLQHLASVRTWTTMKGLRNLRFESRDLSGHEQAKTGATAEPLAFLRDIPDLDFVVSANLLSQIGVGIGRIIEGDQGSTRIIPQLLQAHLDGLSSLSAGICLLTDMSYEVIDKSGRVLERDDLMHGVRLPEPQAEWLWPVAPFGELAPDCQAVHRVVAIDLRRSRPGLWR
jgi:hypothetical protein